MRDAIRTFSSLKLKVQITELDMSVYPWEKNRRSKRPDESDAYTPEVEQKQAERYKKVFQIFREEKKAQTGVTFWNISDKHTWLDTYPVPVVKLPASVRHQSTAEKGLLGRREILDLWSRPPAIKFSKRSG